MYWILLIAVLGSSLIVSSIFNGRRKKYMNVPLRAGLSGKEVAEKMLRENGVYDVHVTASDGILTDHYNPRTKTVNLSSDIYNGRSVFSAAVAAHECGHAVQHATAYAFLQLRSALVPMVTFSSKLVMWVIIGGMILMSMKDFLHLGENIMLAGIILFGVTTFFSFITLPVEFNASNRAKAWLQNSGMTNSTEMVQVRDSLKWAAMTYVIAALASLANLLYYIMIFIGRRS